MMDPQVLGNMFRNLQQFHALFETTGQDTITGPEGEIYCLHDIQRLYDARFLLSLRQSQAIGMFLHADLRERDVAVGLGVSEANPVAVYAAQGLQRLCELHEMGVIPGMEAERNDNIYASA